MPSSLYPAQKLIDLASNEFLRISFLKESPPYWTDSVTRAFYSFPSWEMLKKQVSACFGKAVWKTEDFEGTEEKLDRGFLL